MPGQYASTHTVSQPVMRTRGRQVCGTAGPPSSRLQAGMRRQLQQAALGWQRTPSSPRPGHLVMDIM